MKRVVALNKQRFRHVGQEVFQNGRNFVHRIQVGLQELRNFVRTLRLDKIHQFLLLLDFPTASKYAFLFQALQIKQYDRKQRGEEVPKVLVSEADRKSANVILLEG